MIKLKIEGMSCDHCVRAVTKALTEVPGVTRVVEVSLDRGEAIVEGEAAIEQLAAAVREEGYQVAPTT
ncbi:MAG: heavy metal-binding protein [Acidobacteria bacterium]|nr:MAG: heavy metal-binding protein [Acidobacteriota bacterium]